MQEVVHIVIEENNPSNIENGNSKDLDLDWYFVKVY